MTKSCIQETHLLSGHTNHQHMYHFKPKTELSQGKEVERETDIKTTRGY